MTALGRVTTEQFRLTQLDDAIYDLEGEWDRLPWESMHKAEVSRQLACLRAERDVLDRQLYPEARS